MLENTDLDGFFDYLAEKNIATSADSCQILNWDTTEIMELVSEGYLLLQMKREPLDSVFNFSPNANLSGAPYTCGGLGCRLDRVSSLSRFSALYADDVRIRNPFEDYVLDEDFPKLLEGSLERYRSKICGDIITLFFFRPLIEAGLISIRPGFIALCGEHMSEFENVQKQIGERIQTAEKLLDSEFRKRTKVEITNLEDEIFLKITGPKSVVEHGEIHVVGKLPDELTSKFVMDKSRVLTNRELKKFGVHQKSVYQIADDLFEQNIDVYLNRSSYLSDRELDLELTKGFGDPEIRSISVGLINGLRHSIPVVTNVSIEKLIELRKKEGSAFQVYRDSVSSVLNKAKGLSHKEIAECIDDEIRPAINQIRRTFENSNTLLFGKIDRDIAIGTGFLAIGVFTGFLTQEAAALIALIGGAKYVREVSENIAGFGKPSQKMLENPYFFLWQLDNKSKEGDQPYIGELGA